LKQYFQQILVWFDRTLLQFFQKHNCRSAERNQERIDAIYAAVPATNDAAVLEAGTLTARGLVALLRTLRDNIAGLDRRINSPWRTVMVCCSLRCQARVRHWCRV
jgi:hypothetical protein